MPMVRKRDSIYFQLFQLLVLAALVSGLFFPGYKLGGGQSAELVLYKFQL